MWSYDTAGNILSRTEYGYTTGELGTPTDTVNYTYGDTDWGDLLTAYDGVNISYDGIGNPLSDGTWSYTWEHGRELAAMTDGSTTWNYTYDVNGLRTSRTNGTTTYNYIYNGSSLSKLTVGNNTLYFTYSAEGHPLTLTHNGTTYFYATNLQGDVVAILNASGTPVVRYTYDAWGNPLTVTDTSNISLATLNPLRYRGYVFDHETGLYYLQSRYYDPEIERFISVDSVFDYDAGLQGYDLFVYCGNNPVIRIDISGTDSDLMDVEDLDDEFEPRLEGASGNGVPPTPGGGGGYGPISDIKTSGVPAGNAAAGGSGTGYSSMSAFKRANGSAGEGYEWHHIVEQSQIKKSGFSPEEIHNTNNVTRIETSVHREVSRYYSTKQGDLGGLTPRDYLRGRSYEFQFDFGKDILNRFHTVR